MPGRITVRLSDEEVAALEAATETDGRPHTVSQAVRDAIDATYVGEVTWEDRRGERQRELRADGGDR